jgi:hypothetical protein
MRFHALSHLCVAAFVLVGASAALAEPAPKAAAASTDGSGEKAPADAANENVAKRREEWRQAMLRLPHPKPGCYTASFPRVEWKAVPCGPPPKRPIVPARNPARHFVVGGGGSNDFSARPAGTISGVDGTFVSVSPGVTESGPVANTGPSVADTYTLQINANQFSSSACAGSPNPNCKGWEQFVYVNDSSSHFVFIQYWLIKYNKPTCPSGWTFFQFSGDTNSYCFQSTGTSPLAHGHPASDLGNTTLSAAVTPSSDQATITSAGDMAMLMGSNAVALAAGWTDAEFNVFGDGGNSSGGGQAGFGANTTLVVRTTAHHGNTNAPTCQMESFTGETNNLTLVGMSAIGTQPSPAIEFTQSNVPGTPAACVTANGVGDTHLSTFGGLLYDFQASGDFVLAQTGPDFVVEARQVSGAPSWPNASINKAVATQMGKTRVALCSGEDSEIHVDGRSRRIADGATLSLPSGVDIQHLGNVYVVVDQGGNSLRAELDGSYINVSVGLGRWPTKVRGILANVADHPNQIETKGGTVLSAPFAFADLYHAYADSWRVPPQDGLLSVCGRATQVGIPKAPLNAKDLDPQLYKRSRETCARAGVKQEALLEACTLDVAVLGRADAAKVFLGLRTPSAVGGIAR